MLLKGDCLVTLKTLPDNSVDSIVTDPPYGLEFMGKEWDAPWKRVGDVIDDPADVGGFQDGAGGNAFSRSRIRYGIGNSASIGFQVWFTEVALECFRVLKPGGHILSFGGTRTYHRMAVAIEDAGFEIRDSIHWTYGSGFPKSMDVSKAIDKSAGRVNVSLVVLKNRLRELFEESGKTLSQIDTECGFRAANYLTIPKDGNKPDPWVNVLPSQEKWEIIKQVLGVVDGSEISNQLDVFFSEAEREIIGSQTKARSTTGNSALPTVGGETEYATWGVTAPATDQAKQWSGWGTAMKPSHEPIVVARKPVEGTVANNVLKYGTGAINIDGTRVGTTNENFDNLKGRPITKLATRRDGETDEEYNARVLESPEQQEALAKLKEMGRWPANTILTHSINCVQVGTTSEIVAINKIEEWSGFGQVKNPDYQASESTVENAVWNCAPDCPTQMFPDSKGSIRNPTGKAILDPEAGWNGNSMSDTTVRGFDDSGSAARFFTQTSYGEADVQGRWPANTILTHSSLCRQVGETSETVVTTNGKGFAGSFEGGENNNGGAETKVSTPIWECADDCPTKLFPESNGGAFPKKGNTPTGEHYEGGWKPVDNGVRTEMGSGSASRFFNQTEYDDDIDFPPIIYQAKASKADRNAGLNWVRPEEGKGSYNFRVNGSLDGKQTAPKQNIHPTVKPVSLMRHLIRLVTPPNGVVLDPFLGSGTTAVASILEGCQWIGCEMTEDYWHIIEKRVEWATFQANAPKQESLF